MTNGKSKKVLTGVQRYTVDGHCVIIDGDLTKLVCDCSDYGMEKSEEQAKQDAIKIAEALNHLEEQK